MDSATTRLPITCTDNSKPVNEYMYYIEWVHLGCINLMCAVTKFLTLPQISNQLEVSCLNMQKRQSGYITTVHTIIIILRSHFGHGVL